MAITIKPDASTTAALSTNKAAETPATDARKPAFGKQTPKSSPLARDGFVAGEAKTDFGMATRELDRAPLFRHIDFFDANHDGKLVVSEIADGLQKLGMNKLAAWAVAAGTIAVRGPSTTGSLKPEIDIANAMKSEQQGSTHLFDAQGNVNMADVEKFISKLDPNGTGKITIDNFDAWGKELAVERDPGNGLLDPLKRKKVELEFHTAWNGVLNGVGHTDPADPAGKKYLTPNDVRWFYDGSLFYRRAQEVAANKG